MAYLPHSVLAASGRLHCVIEAARISSDTGKASGLGRYMVLADMKVIGAPGDQLLSNVRYFGPMTLSTGSAVMVYDELIEGLLGAHTHAEVSGFVDIALLGRLVTPISVGGRWIVR